MLALTKISKIGSRRSNCYSRIYETKNSLKFEHEMKGKFLQEYHFLLVGNRLEEFEQKLSSHFLVYFGKLLPLQFSYLDCLVIKLRPIRKQRIDFFDELQTSSLIKSFTDTEYRSLVTVPEVKLQKSKQNCWAAKILIAEELFYYPHPFLIPDLFKRKLRKYEFEVIQVFSSVDLEKSFFKIIHQH